MTDYPYDSLLVADPGTFQRAVNGSIYVYDASDTTNSAPLALKDPTGLPLTNPLKSSADAFTPPFYAPSQDIKMVGAGLTVFVSSAKGMRDAAAASAAAAEAARTQAEVAAANAAEAASTALADAVADAEASRAAAAAAAALVGAPADAAIAAAVNGNGATKAALSATILDKIKTDSVPRWKPTTAYLAGDKVLSPTGDVVSAKTGFTSGATFDSANWDYTTASPAVVSGAVAAEQVRADAAYRPKDSTIFIPYDHSWWAALVTQGEGFGPDGSGNPRRIWGLLMSGATPADSLNNPGAHTKFRVPAGWNTVSVKIIYSPTTSAGGNAAWNGGLYNASDGNNYNAGTGIASSATSVGTTAWVQKSHQASTVVAVDSTKTQILHIYRNALSATDTYNDDVLFLGVEVNWIS